MYYFFFYLLWFFRNTLNLRNTLIFAIKITYLRQHLLWSSSSCYLSTILHSSSRSIDSSIADCHCHCNAHEYHCLHRHRAVPRSAKRCIARTMIAIPGDRRIERRDNRDQLWYASIAYRFRWASAGVNSDRSHPVKLRWICTICYSNRI